MKIETIAAGFALVLAVGGYSVAQTSTDSMKSGATDPSGQATPAGPAAKKSMQGGDSAATTSGSTAGGQATGAGENTPSATGGQPGGAAGKN